MSKYKKIMDKAIYRLWYTGYDKEYSRKEAMHDLLKARDKYEKALSKAIDILCNDLKCEDCRYKKGCLNDGEELCPYNWEEELMKDES